MDENGTVATVERETTYQEEPASVPILPSVQVFKEIVGRHCRNWSASSVDELCTEQTRALIVELAEHFR